MDRKPARKRLRGLTQIIGLMFLAFALAGCPGGGKNGGSTGGGGGLPKPGTSEYQQVVSAFYVGLAALQVLESRAKPQFEQVTKLAPDEPAGWANLGLLALRSNDFPAAQASLDKAKALAPDNYQIELLLGALAGRQGIAAGALEHLRRAVLLKPDNLKAQYALAQELERQGGEAYLAEYEQILGGIIEKQPTNLLARLDLIRITAKRGKPTSVRPAVEQLANMGSKWPADVQVQLKALQAAADKGDTRAAATNVQQLRNVLARFEPALQQGENALKPSDRSAGFPLTHFVKMPYPSPLPAAPDTGLTFAAEPVSLGANKWQWAGLLYAGEEKPARPFAANGREVRFADGVTLPFPGGAAKTPPTPSGVLMVDLNYDFLPDLALAGAGGVKIYLQTPDGKFTDQTDKAMLPPVVLKGAYAGAWAMDIELDGDMDILLGAVNGAPVALRNNGGGIKNGTPINGGGTFKVVPLFQSVSGLRGFVLGDLDGDGDPDVALWDAKNKLRVFSNERSGLFQERTLPTSVGAAAALTIADVDGDDIFDLIVLQTDGALIRLSDKSEGAQFEATEIARWQDAPATLGDGKTILFNAELDNNGALDFVASGTAGSKAWLCDTQRAFAPLASPLEGRVFAAADLNNDGHLDLMGLSASGELVKLTNKGTKSYHWQVLRPIAGTTPGKPDIRVDFKQRINTFGIGGEMQVRSGLLAQKQCISGPVLHYGLGENPAVEVAWMVWPNGQTQAEFPQADNNQLKADLALQMKQGLTISCPFLFAFNGKEMQFVTDCIWRSPLGLRINAQATAGIQQTEDWVKIRSDQLAPRDGMYDLRITAELRETHFFDHLSLMVVDHPAGTEIFVDERFAVPPPKLAIHTTAPPQPFAHIWDDDRNEVSEILRERDGNHLHNFGREAYQGVTRDHYVEVELPEDAPKSGPLWLIANGWIRPTNSSVNVAIGQSEHTPPRGLSLETPDSSGKWIAAQSGLGFPEGKLKTILLNLDGVFRPNAPRRVRLRTNLEIYWDALSWASGKPDAPTKITRLEADKAELRYRGFSVIKAKDDSSPELPESYDQLETRWQKWRDLTGNYTRFGDIRALLKKVDDRYVIMNAGDEMALLFPEQPAPPPGMVRDYVLVGDGWVKDGDPNTTFSKTVLPLPTHANDNYSTPPRRLEDDPVYRLHAQDWKDYHTRFVAPRRFQRGLSLRDEE